MLNFEQCFILFSSFPLLLAFVVGGLGFEFRVFAAGWRHALRSEWPLIIIIILPYYCWHAFPGFALQPMSCSLQSRPQPNPRTLDGYYPPSRLVSNYIPHYCYRINLVLFS